MLGCLNEGFEDVIRLAIKVRMSLSQPSDPGLIDVLTDLRSIEGVSTVRQVGATYKDDLSAHKEWANFIVSFDSIFPGEPREVAEAALRIEGIDLVKLVAVDGKQLPKPVVLSRHVRDENPGREISPGLPDN